MQMAMLGCILPRVHTQASQKHETAASNGLIHHIQCLFQRSSDVLIFLSQTKPEKPVFEKTKLGKNQ
jgi:hypothetical protein